MDIGQDSHSRATTVAFQDVELKDTGHRLSPCVIPRANGSRLCTPAILTSVSCRSSAPESEGTTSARRRAPGAKTPWYRTRLNRGRWDEGGELLQQFQGLEDDVCPPVAPAVPEFIHHAQEFPAPPCAILRRSVRHKRTPATCRLLDGRSGENPV
jgi:hypothetical protein